jgi:hypothetical protein
MTESKQLLPRREWLYENGLVRDPFEAEARRAETDELLSSTGDVFIEFPYHHEITGSIRDPGPRFIFANRGCGKTALRLSIERKLNENLVKSTEPPILVVPYCQFDTVLANVDNEPSKVTPRDHVEQIIQLILERLFEILSSDSTALSTMLKQKLKDPSTRKLFLWYLAVFGALYPWELDRLTARVDGLRSILDGETVLEFTKSIANLAGETLTPASFQKLIGKTVELIKLPERRDLDKSRVTIKKQLEDILAVCRQFGFTGIYILVDNVDEPQYYGENKDFHPAFQLIHTLASASGILGIPGIVFKFFLPKEMRPQCRNSLRLDIYGDREIVWDKESLEKLLNQRLNACWKKDERREKYSLADLCNDELKLHIDERIVAFATEYKSPRALIYLGNELLAEHFCNGFRKTDDKISIETWERARQRAEEVLHDTSQCNHTC